MSHIVKGLIGIAWLCVAQQSAAQMPTNFSFETADTLKVEGTKRGPHWVVKFSPLSVIDVESIYRVDVERILSGRFSVQGGLAYGNRAIQLWPNNNSIAPDREIWRAQLEGRMYINRTRPANRWRPYQLTVSKPLGSYVAFEIFYKQANAHFDGVLERGCDNGNCQFFESYSARALRYVVGGHLKIGRQSAIRLSETNNRLLIDYYFGLGLRARWFEQRGVPDYEDARPAMFTRNWDRTSDFSLQAGRYPSLAFGVQIGYAF